jgi:hypothetical protein
VIFTGQTTITARSINPSRSESRVAQQQERHAWQRKVRMDLERVRRKNHQLPGEPTNQIGVFMEVRKTSRLSPGMSFSRLKTGTLHGFRPLIQFRPSNLSKSVWITTPWCNGSTTVSGTVSWGSSPCGVIWVQMLKNDMDHGDV